MGFFGRLFRSKIEKMEEKRDVEGLIEMLEDDNDNNKVDAVRALGRIGDHQAIDPLYNLITPKIVTSKPGYSRHERKVSAIIEANAAIALVMIGDSRIIKVIFSSDYYYSKWSDDQTYQSVIQALDKIGKPAIDAIIEVLKSIFDSSRSKAVEVLDDLGWKPRNDVEKAWYMVAKRNWDEVEKLGESAIEPLLATITQTKRELYGPAMQALYRIGEPAIPSLIDLLLDGMNLWGLQRLKKRMREEGVVFRDKMKSPVTFKPLIEKTTETIYDVNHRLDMREGLQLVDTDKRRNRIKKLVEVIWLFGGLAKSSLGEALIQTMDDNSKIYRHGGRLEQESAWKDIAYFFIVCGVLEPKNKVKRTHYLIANNRWNEIGRLGKPVVEPLAQYLKNNVDPLVRRKAAIALGKTRTVSAVKHLIQALEDKGIYFEDEDLAYKADSEEVSFSPLEAIVKIGKRAEPTLLKALKNSNSERIRAYTAEALRRIELAN